MIHALESFVESNNIAIKKSKILLAISGGIDSVVLAHLFHQLGVQFSMVHCNFKLRDQDSDSDDQFVKKLAATYNVGFYSTSFKTAKIAQERGVSIQMAARDLRYEWFEKIRSNYSYDLIATAHHKGDVVETVLFNLTRGTGLEGLHGINPKYGNVIRPMLFAERKDIELYAKKNGIEWKEDSSNKLVKYSRNKIRHQVVPVLEEINPKAQQAIFSTSLRIKETERFLNAALEKTAQTLITLNNDNLSINIKKLIAIPGHTYVLHQILKEYGFNYSQVENISKALLGLSGKLFHSTSHTLNVDRQEVIISKTQNASTSNVMDKVEGDFIFDNQTLSTRIISNDNYQIKNNNKVLALDISKLLFPLEIRGWQKGDVFQPLGMKGKKKLSDFMIDAKIPVNLKQQVRVVLSNNQIVGILNYRLDRRFKIDNSTEMVFEITCK